MTMRNGLTFQQWKSQVNREIGRIVGLSADDLPDQAYWDMWEAGQSPKSVAQEVLAEEGFEGEMGGDDE